MSDQEKKSKTPAAPTQPEKPMPEKSREKGKLRELGIHMSEEAVDVSTASWDESLSKVWVDEATGELCASIDRMLFESPASAAARFMEPHGFNLNLENILACLDSMKFGVFAKATPAKGPDAKDIAKKIAPAVYMRLPHRTAKGPLLGKFYEEIAKYESELSRLQQYEAQSRRAMQEAVKDESGRAVVVQLQRDNEILREEIERLSRRVAQLSAAIEAVPMHSRETLLPAGMKLCQVRQIKEQDNLVHLKSDAGQYSFPLSQLSGLPTVGARAVALHDGGQIRGLWVFDPLPSPFEVTLATVLAVDGQRMKTRGEDRIERIVEIKSALQEAARGQKIILKIANAVVIDWLPVAVQIHGQIVDQIYDEQTKIQISEADGDSEAFIAEKPQKRRRSAA